MLKHAALFIDHQEARIYRVAVDALTTSKLHMAGHAHRHPDQPSSGKRSVADEEHFFEAVVEALGDLAAIVVLGPSTGKTEFIHYLKRKHPTLHAKVIGVETVDHPTDAQIVALARGKFFPPAADRARIAN